MTFTITNTMYAKNMDPNTLATRAAAVALDFDSLDWLGISLDTDTTSEHASGLVQRVVVLASSGAGPVPDAEIPNYLAGGIFANTLEQALSVPVTSVP